MAGHGVRWSADVDQASWVVSRLSPSNSDRADSVIPSGYAAYVRLLHPMSAEDDHGNERPVRWATVATWSGTELTTNSQFHDIALPTRAPAAPAPWDGLGPLRGTLGVGYATTLVDLLRGHTVGEQECWFCLWDGYGQHEHRPLAYTVEDTHSPEPPNTPDPQLPTTGNTHDRDAPFGTWMAIRTVDPVPPDVRAGPRVRLPESGDCLLYVGPIEDALAFTAPSSQTPTLWWPVDRSWCVASDPNLPWTYVAGTDELITRITQHPSLEAQRVQPNDPIRLRLSGRLHSITTAAIDELLACNSATVVTARGSIEARLKHPTRWRDGTLSIVMHDPNDPEELARTTNLPLARHQSTKDLQRTIHQQLTTAVAMLATQYPD